MPSPDRAFRFKNKYIDRHGNPSYDIVGLDGRYLGRVERSALGHWWLTATHVKGGLGNGPERKYPSREDAGYGALVAEYIRDRKKETP